MRGPAALLGLLLLVGVAVRVRLVVGNVLDYDEGVYWQSVRSLAAGHDLYSEVYSSQPPAFLGALAPVYSLGGHTLTAMRGSMLVAFAVTVVCAYAAARMLGGDRAGVAAAALISLDPLLLRQSVVVQAEGPAVALALAAVALALTAQRRSGRGGDVLAVLAGACVALGALTKLLDVTVAVPVAVLLAAHAEGDGKRWSWRRPGLAVVGAAVAGAAVLLPLQPRWREVWDQTIGLHLDSHSVDEGGLSSEMQVALLRETPVALAGIAGLVLLARYARVAAVALAAWALAAAAAVFAQHPVWPHHVAAVVPPLAIGGGIALGALIDAARRQVRLGARAAAVGAASLGAALGVVAGGAMFDLYQRSGSSSDLAERLAAATAPGDVVVTDDQYAAAQAGRDTPPELVDTSLVRIRSGHLSGDTARSATVRVGARGVLFATGRIEHIDGFVAWVVEQFPVRVDLGDGRVLYLRAR
jgi:4-amino-4-deoxy-L-arabinose transferase-like glycosyltransferase